MHQAVRIMHMLSLHHGVTCGICMEPVSSVMHALKNFDPVSALICWSGMLAVGTCPLTGPANRGKPMTLMGLSLALAGASPCTTFSARRSPNLGSKSLYSC